ARSAWPMTPASALRKDANRASLLVSPNRNMLAPPSGQRGTPYAPVAALNTRPCDSVRIGVWMRDVLGARDDLKGLGQAAGIERRVVAAVDARWGCAEALAHDPLG